MVSGDKSYDLFWREAKQKREQKEEGGTTPLYALFQRPFLEPTWNRLYKSERASLCSNVGGRVSW